MRSQNLNSLQNKHRDKKISTFFLLLILNGVESKLEVATHKNKENCKALFFVRIFVLKLASIYFFARLHKPFQSDIEKQVLVQY